MEITIKEYAKLANITPAGICYRMKQKKTLPGITKIKFDKVNRRYILTYNGEKPKGIFRSYIPN